MHLPLFSQRIIKMALSIPPGKVTTYGRLARACGGGAMAAQSVTAILGKATQNGVRGIPYHRIVYADGRAWMDPANRKSRLMLYKKEGIALDEDDKVVGFKEKVVG